MVKLYTTHCPQCIMLENLLKQKKVNFERVKVTEEDIKNMGYLGAPLLEVDGDMLNFSEGKAWVLKKK